MNPVRLFVHLTKDFLLILHLFFLPVFLSFDSSCNNLVSEVASFVLYSQSLYNLKIEISKKTSKNHSTHTLFRLTPVHKRDKKKTHTHTHKTVYPVFYKKRMIEHKKGHSPYSSISCRRQRPNISSHSSTSNR